jgi:hypothetical protein
MGWLTNTIQNGWEMLWGTGADAGPTMTSIVQQTQHVTTVVGNVFGLILSNPILVFFMSAGLVMTGIRVFKGLRRAAR